MALTKSAKVWTPKPKAEITREMGRDRYNERGKFFNKPSLWKWNSLSGFLFLEVILQKDSDTTLLYLPPPFSIGHPLCSARGICHLATTLQQKYKARMKSGFWHLLLPSTHGTSFKQSQEIYSFIRPRLRARGGLQRCLHSVPLRTHPGLLQPGQRVLIKLQGYKD